MEEFTTQAAFIRASNSLRRTRSLRIGIQVNRQRQELQRAKNGIFKIQYENFTLRQTIQEENIKIEEALATIRELREKLTTVQEDVCIFFYL